MNNNNIGFIKNPAENFYARKGSMRLYLGCDQDRYHIDINLNTYGVDSWDNYRISKLTITPKSITAVQLGPRTVVDLYRGDMFIGNKRTVENPSYSDTKYLEIGCVQDDPFWLGAVRSFKIWDYDYWDRLNGTRYCNSDSECYENEYCLCRNGCQDPAWCKKSKRRCLPVSRYLQCRKPSVAPLTPVKKSCLQDQLAYNLNSFVPFKEIKDMSNNCFGPDVSNDVYTFYNYDADMKEAFCGGCNGGYKNYLPNNPYRREHFGNVSNFNILRFIILIVLIGLVYHSIKA